jgi:type IV secretion system protein VirB5
MIIALQVRRAASALLIAAAVAPSASAQTPVIDGAAIAKQAEQIAQLKKQLEQAKALYDKTTELYGSLNRITGVKDLAMLLNDKSFQKYLPQEYAQYANAANSLIKGNVNGFAQKYDYYSREGNSAANSFYYQELKRRKGETYQDMAVGEAVYNAASKRLDELNKLKDALGSASSPKAVMDLQARLLGESALLQNEILRMQGLAMIQAARGRVDEQREQEKIDRMGDQIEAAIKAGG